MEQHQGKAESTSRPIVAESGHRRLRALILTPWFPIASKPYAGVFVRNQAIATSRHCDVIVVHICLTVMRPALLNGRCQDPDLSLTGGLPCYRVFVRGGRFGYLPSPVDAINILRVLRHVRHQYGAWDVVHVHVFTRALLGLAIARLWRTPLLITEHFSIIQRRRLSALQALCLRWCCRRAQAVLPVSHTLKQAMQSYGVRAPFNVVANTVDTSIFHPPMRRMHDDAMIRIVNVNSLLKSKGVGTLLKALARVPSTYSWHLDILGDGPHRQVFESMAAALGIEDVVTFHGMALPAEVARSMRQADFFVLASESETFSVATAEALCSGLPVLVTRCGGPEEFVDESCGRLVPAEDVPAMTMGLQEMFDCLEHFDRQEIAHRAQLRFGHQQIGSQISGLYQQLVRAKNMPG